MKSYFKPILLSVMLYAFIYSPPFQGMFLTPVQWLVPVAYLYIAYQKLFRKFLGTFRKEIGILAALAGYTLARNLFSDSANPFFFPNLLLMLEVFPIAFFLAEYCREEGAPSVAAKERILNAVVIVSFAAAAITLFLILNPILSFLINNFVLRTNEFAETATHRCFGLSASLTYSYAIAQGTMASIVLYKMTTVPVRSLPLYAVAFFALFISVIFNARIGLAPMLLMGAYLFMLKRSVNLILGAIVTALLLYFVLYDSQYSTYFEENLAWSTQFFTETWDFITNEQGSTPNTYETLFGDMLFVPDSFGDWIFGTGQNVYVDTEQTSDVGYVRQLFFGGLLYLYLLFSLIWTMYQRIRGCRSTKWLAYLFLSTVLVANVKGYFIFNDVAFRLFVLIYVGFVYYDSISSSSVPAPRLRSYAS